VTDGSVRRGLLISVALRVLAGAEGPLAAGEVVARVAREVELNERELSLNDSGYQRYSTMINFKTTALVAAGWMTKPRHGHWQITDAGRRALAEYPPDRIERELGRLYQRWQTARKQRGAEDSSTALLRLVVEAIPDGRFTTYSDLADVIGVSLSWVTGFLGNVEVAGSHRVLGGGYEVPLERRDVLSAEGIRISSGRADATQRLTPEELRELADLPAKQRAWLVRGAAVSGQNLVPRWLDDGFVSLQAQHLRALEPGVAFDEVRAAVDEDYAHVPYTQRQATTTDVHAFLSRIDVGDVVATTSEGRLYVGRVTGDPVFPVDSGDTRVSIRRTVEWRAESTPFAGLGSTLQGKLSGQQVVTDLTSVLDELEALLGDPREPAPSPAVPARAVVLPALTAADADDLLVARSWLDEFVALLRARRQIIVQGPPGTGKTFISLRIAEALTDPANVTVVQFHPAYSYEDFFEGYRPVGTTDGGGLQFALTPGPLRTIADRAREDPATPYILVVDEINRANLAKVFGELYFLLEYRNRSIDLTYTSGDRGRSFSLPDNVFIIGTMNTADRSIALVDTAMRRRFAFLSLHPDDTHLRGVLRAWLVRRNLPTHVADLHEALNRRIEDPQMRIGPSYLMDPAVADDAGLERIWRTSILPVLAELHIDETLDVEQWYGLATLRRAVPAAPAGAEAGEPAEPPGDPRPGA
jgi:5-methylcytosine-specific restriction protein B